jgi:protein TonB
MAHSASHSLAEAGFVSPALSQRAVMFGAIVALHVVLVYLFASGLAVTTVKRVFESSIVDLIDEPQKNQQAPPPPTPVDFTPPSEPDLGPLPDINVPADSGSGTTITLPPPIGETRVIDTPPRVEPIHLVGKHQLPNTEDYYPPSLRRLGVEGATSISVCVDERGKRTGEPTVTESSGNARLDEGALAIARVGKYARSARGETFVPNCYGFKIIFQMQKP